MNVYITALLIVTLVVSQLMAFCASYFLYYGVDEETLANFKKLLDFLSIVVKLLVEQFTATLSK